MDSGKEKKKKNESKKEIIEKVKDGDKEAFNALIRIYQQKIFKLAYCYFQNKEDAMEIVQETFLRVYQKIKYFNEEKNFQNWIYRIASNLCVDYYRKIYKKEKKLLNKIKEKFILSTNNKKQLKILDLKDILKKSLQFLPHKQRIIFIMKHYEGLKYNEISRILKISVGTVKSLNHRAIKNLQIIANKFIRDKNEKM